MGKQAKYTVSRILIGPARIKRRIRKIASVINREYRKKNLYIIVVLKGSFVFAADLLRSINVDTDIDFVKVQSYGASMTSQKLLWSMKFTGNVTGKDVLLIDDIYDTGKTLYNVVKYIKKLKPASIKVCVLLKKKRPRTKNREIAVDHVGFEVPDVFAVGYGLDFDGKYRNLPYIAEMRKR